MKKIDKSIIITAIITLGVIEAVAMCFGINGTLRTLIIGAICALSGLAINTEKFLKGGVK